MRAKLNSFLSPPAALMITFFASGAFGGETLKVGLAAPASFDSVPAEVGVSAGVFAKHNLDVQIVGFGGDARVHQAIASGDIEIGLGGSQGVAFIAKGAPEIAVAAVIGPPMDVALISSYGSPLRSLDDLKGKKVGISTGGSLTYWLTAELNRQRGWGVQGAQPVEIGDFAGRIAALKTGQIDVTFASVGLAYQMEEQKTGWLLAPASQITSDFISDVLFGSDHLVASNPNALRRFLAGWFESVVFMRAHKTETVSIARKSTALDELSTSREYDATIDMFSTNGRFAKSAVDVLGHSLVALKLLDRLPDMSTLYTEKFLNP